jgi:hypothetical protein
MIPIYQRGSNQIKLKSSSIRVREKILIFLVLLTFCFVCFGGLFFLPDNFGSDSVRQVYNKFKKHGPEIFIPAPPVEKRDFDIDRIKLQEKIRNEFNDDEILEKPELDRNSNSNNNNQQHQNIPIVPPPVPEQHKNQIDANNKPPTVLSTSENLSYSIDGEDSDPEAKERRNKVKEVIKKFDLKKMSAKN